MHEIRRVRREWTYLGEDKNENHSDEETRLLGSSANSSISDDSDSVSSSKTTEAASETSCQMGKALVQIVAFRGSADLEALIEP